MSANPVERRFKLKTCHTMLRFSRSFRLVIRFDGSSNYIPPLTFLKFVNVDKREKQAWQGLRRKDSSETLNMKFLLLCLKKSKGIYLLFFYPRAWFIYSHKGRFRGLTAVLFVLFIVKK